jgi:hypothetical protein
MRYAILLDATRLPFQWLRLALRSLITSSSSAIEARTRERALATARMSNCLARTDKKRHGQLKQYYHLARSTEQSGPGKPGPNFWISN